MSDTVCLSIIVPIYNVEKYLGRCLDSLLQTGNIGRTQIILVDDGSTDQSGAIAEEYVQKYGFIECFHKSNGGLSDARNYGLKKATGRYVFFCDSDDMVIPDGLRNVIEIAESTMVDVILWNGIAIDEEDRQIQSAYEDLLVHSGVDSSHVMTGLDALIGQVMHHNRIAVTAWLRACRREFLLDNGLFFKVGLLHEDELWTPSVLLLAKSVIYTEQKAYCYRIRDNSIMSMSYGGQEKHARSLVSVLNELYDLYVELIKNRSLLGVVLSYWADVYLWEISFYGIGRYECRRFIPRRQIFRCAKRPKAVIKALILISFGSKVYCRLFK